MPNVLRFSIQPESIEIDLQAKKPGLEYDTQEITLKYNYDDQTQTNAYERVLADAVREATRTSVCYKWHEVMRSLADYRTGYQSLVV